MFYCIVLAIASILCCSTYAIPVGHFARQDISFVDQEWDMIVVGAGPAGIIAATRLSEAGKKTLLLEQGGPSYGIVGGTERPDWLSGTNLSRVDVPGLYKSIFSGTSNLTCGKRLSAFGGCTIGGSSAINAGLFFQPPASDWDQFFPEGWKNADVAPAIEKVYARQSSVIRTSVNQQLYLQSGYNIARKWLVDGANFTDTDINGDADHKHQVFGHPAYDYDNGQRGGPVTTYLQAALQLPNFQLQSNVQVQRIVRQGSHATGVFATVGGTDRTIRLSSTGRVILSAGALMSPQLLMLSGIGEPQTLSRLSLVGKVTLPSNEWINNTAIGDRLFDNPNTFIELSSPSVKSYTYDYASPPASDEELYLRSRSGPYSFASQTSVFWSYVNHTDATNSTEPASGMQGTIDSSGYAMSAESNTSITLNVYGTSGLLSRGRVVLNSDFAPGPSAETYYSNPRDAASIATFIHSIFSSLPADLTPLNIPRNATHDEIQTYITTPSAYAVGQVNHFSSSCQIGKCVDIQTRVVGMDNLHVVDASIVEPLTVNPQFGVMIAAERASDLILAL